MGEPDVEGGGLIEFLEGKLSSLPEVWRGTREDSPDVETATVCEATDEGAEGSANGDFESVRRGWIDGADNG